MGRHWDALATGAAFSGLLIFALTFRNPSRIRLAPIGPG